ncbi:hypothetical protein [Yoonia sp. 2307UL14-13]|uniref:hypothetical protein n=1 Tax=Yoonia sp. 2307UL14-13 TaxID=3126506 RepID=UPI0030A15F33
MIRLSLTRALGLTWLAVPALAENALTPIMRLSPAPTHTRSSACNRAIHLMMF